MAPVDMYHAPSHVPAYIAGLHVSLTIYASLLIIRTAYRSYLALPPAGNTRHRESSRHKHVKAFSGLALASFLAAAYYASKYCWLSYRVWAAQRGVVLPNGLFGDDGALRAGEHPGRLHVFAWLYNTNIYHDALELTTEKARYYWWAQQLNLATIAWSIYLAVEGRRRRIPHLWAFTLLGQLVSLSYAQNLFFIMLLLTPIPLPRNVKAITASGMPLHGSLYVAAARRNEGPPLTCDRPSRMLQGITNVLPQKPTGWQTSPYVLALVAISFYLTNFLLPFAVNTPAFDVVAALSRTLPYAPLLSYYLLPRYFGSITTHARSRVYINLIRVLLVLSGTMHLLVSALALHHNTPSATFHRHSILHPFQSEHRATSTRALIAVERLFGAIGEHPTISTIGADVILSGLSLCIWSVVKGLNGRSLLALPSGTPSVSEAADTVKNALVDVGEGIKEKRRPGRPKKETASSPTEVSAAATSGTLTRRSGRTSRQQDLIEQDNTALDTTYQPTDLEEEGTLALYGDEDVEDEDWEVGTLVAGVLALGGLGTGWASVAGGSLL